MWPLYCAPKYLVEASTRIQVRADRVSDLGKTSREAEHILLDDGRRYRVGRMAEVIFEIDS